MNIRPARPTDAPALARLDRRLRTAGRNVVVCPPDEKAPSSSEHGTETYFVVEDGDEVRGSVYLRTSLLHIGEETVQIGWIKYPVAESLIDGRFAGVPAAMILHLQRQNPTLLAVGMGGPEGPLAKLLTALRWSGGVIPTFVLPIDPIAVASELPHLAKRTWLRRAARVARGIGLGPAARVGIRATTLLRATALSKGATVRTEVEPPFDWNKVFAAATSEYLAISERTAASVSRLLPPSAPGVRYWTISRDGLDIGWAAAQLLDFRDAPFRPYGALRVGIVHDMLSLVNDASVVVSLAAASLAREGAQLLLANHSVPAWGRAFRDIGFLRAPESFACLGSPALVERLSRAGISPLDLYLTRGDDGFLNPAHGT
jgi:hypothetical protein